MGHRRSDAVSDDLHWLWDGNLRPMDPKSFAGHELARGLLEMRRLWPIFGRNQHHLFCAEWKNLLQKRLFKVWQNVLHNFIY